MGNHPAKFHPDAIWSDGTLGFIEESLPNNNNNQMSCNMVSVPNPQKQKYKQDVILYLC